MTKDNILSKIGSVVFNALRENVIVQGVIIGLIAFLLVIGIGLILISHGIK